MTERTRLAVWGDPIGHSRSPALHAAAYRTLGLHWTYDRRRVDAAGFPAALDALDATWRGLSLTMPLKEAAHAAADQLDAHARLTGAVNTLLLGSTLQGFNTDVGGIVDAFTNAEVQGIRSVRILGAGATAASALVAAHELGAEIVDVRARRPAAAGRLERIGSELGVAVAVHPFDHPPQEVDATIATLPSGTVLDPTVTAPLTSSGGVLFEAAYAPWPSALAAGWGGETVISGFEMLLYQAVRQIRIFLHGEQERALPDEDVIVAVMRRAAMGD
ncbi:shikimate dehydrogenase family protein [Microbacterium suwonense]|uniref:Shikimate 5-dehydrogenase n=1 Tax=Microbacterium suwonense TaxID=683047 RepID=A0ABM8FS15_9MICO|nr:shikimate dehydrogenase [Microbacterium suwonense]BDZ38253.1 shikimate 5-dehydrogenase [Microbacterium suwonense]